MQNGPQDFDLERFLPYLLNQAAEAASRAFQATYRADYGLTRTQWRLLAHLGKFGALTASEICRRSHIEKTKVSRAVAALEARGWLARTQADSDRRAEILTLTGSGREAFQALGQKAQAYDTALRAELGATTSTQLDLVLRHLIALGEGLPEGD